MMTKYPSLIVLCIISLTGLALSGCTPQAFKTQNAQLVAAPDRVSSLLADAADRAANSLQTLAAIEQAKAPPVNMARLENAPVELRRSRVDTTRYDYLSDLGKGDHVRKA